jgi:hypothetical protein
MVIQIGCEACGKPLRIKDELAGKRIKCPLCGQRQTTPARHTVPAGAGKPGRPAVDGGRAPRPAESVPVVEIRHRETGAVLRRVRADSLHHVDLSGANLACADLSGPGPLLEQWKRERWPPPSKSMPAPAHGPGAVCGLLLMVFGPLVSLLLTAASAWLLEQIPIRLFLMGMILFGICIPGTFIAGLVVLIRGLLQGNFLGGLRRARKPPTRVELFASLIRKLTPVAAESVGAYLATLVDAEAEQLRFVVQEAKAEELRPLLDGLNAASQRGLAHANLEGADLSDALLDGANIKGANLLRANLQGASLRGALYDGVTLLPVDFSPVAAGAKLCW